MSLAHVAGLDGSFPRDTLPIEARRMNEGNRAWATKAARQRLIAEVAANVAAILAGRPRHVVNQPISSQSPEWSERPD